MATLFLLASSFLHALWNTLLKNEKHKNLILFHSILVATILAWVIIFLFDGVHYGQALSLTLLSGVIEGIYFITLAKALNDASLAISYSVMRSLSMLISWLLSFLILGETLNLWSAIGVIFILIGLIIPIVVKQNKYAQKLLWSYLCALTITGYNFIYNRALHLNAKPLTLFATSLAITLPFLYFSLKPEQKKNYFAFKYKNSKLLTSFILGAIILASFSSFLYGLKDTMPAIALTIRNASIPFALIFSHFLGEKLVRQDLYVLIFIIVGVLIVSTVTFYH